MTLSRKTALACAVAAGAMWLGGTATAATIALREGGGGGYTDVTVDDTFVYTFGATEIHGNDTNLRLKYSTFDSGSGRQTLIGWKDLLTLVPPTSGSDVIVIDSATLTLTNAGTTTSGQTFSVNLMTTPWLTGTAGTNETNVNGVRSNVTANTAWAAGLSWYFNTGDFTTTNQVTAVAPTAANAPVSLDITTLMGNLYANANGNQGFCIWNGGTSDIFFASSEATTADYRPTLTMEYHYAPVPEPATLGLIGLGGLGLAAGRRRRS